MPTEKIINPAPDLQPKIPPLEEMRRILSTEEALAQHDLTSAVTTAGISPPVAERYAGLFPEPVNDAGETNGKLSLAILGKKAWEDVKQNHLTRIILGGLITATASRIAEAHGVIGPHIPAPQEIAILLDNLLKWSGSGVTPPLNVLSLLNSLGSAMVYVGVPAKAVELITAAQGRVTAEKVRKQTEAMKIRGEEEQAIREGEADLDGLVGPNIQIDVGESDPAMADLLKLFHTAGFRVVSFCDSKNQFFDIDPAWLRTNNDWTDKETLRRGDVREALCAVILVSNGDDVFLSSRRQDPTRKMQDMTDNEAIGAINARDAVRKQMGLPRLHHILVTNPLRTIEIGIARSGGEPYKPKTVGELVSGLDNVHLIDPDELVVNQIARIAVEPDLPIELVTNMERKVEYQENLVEVLQVHNQEVNAGKRQYKTRLATTEDGKRTLSLIYGSTDEDTIAQVTTYGKEFSQEGDLVAIINDPEKISRLPEGVKYICVGTTVAEAVYQRFFELVNEGTISLPK